MAMLGARAQVSGPVIGVSMVADGRDVALAKQKARVEKMAMTLARHVSKEFRHINGKPSEVIVADELVCDDASAQRVGRRFRDAGVQVLVCYDDVRAYPGELEGLPVQNISVGHILLKRLPDSSAARPFGGSIQNARTSCKSLPSPVVLSDEEARRVRPSLEDDSPRLQISGSLEAGVTPGSSNAKKHGGRKQGHTFRAKCNLYVAGEVRTFVRVPMPDLAPLWVVLRWPGLMIRKMSGLLGEAVRYWLRRLPDLAISTAKWLVAIWQFWTHTGGYSS